MKKKKTTFSKGLLISETILVWIITLAFLVLAAYSVYKGYDGQLTWLTTIVAFPWTAYGVSQACYYNKSAKENTKGGITFETAMKEESNTDGYSG